jgi:hypothetical protein
MLDLTEALIRQGFFYAHSVRTEWAFCFRLAE